jgi:uncharacterized membrane protein YfcA
MDLTLILIGSIGGLLAGIMGVGGGLIFIPVLTYLFSQHGLPTDEIVKFTLANSIALVFASGISGIFRQYRMGIYNFKNSLSVGIPGAAAAALTSYLIQQGSWYNNQRFSYVFLLFLLISISNMLFVRDPQPPSPDPRLPSPDPRLPSPDPRLPPPDPRLPSPDPLKPIFVGLLAGSVVSLSGLGGGIIMVPLFRMFLKMPTKSATALSLSVVPLLAILPIIQYINQPSVPNLPLWHTQYLVWPYYLPMATGVIFFSSFGQKLATKMSAISIRVIFALLSLSILIKTVYELFQTL